MGSSSLQVDLGPMIEAKTSDGNEVESPVGLAVATRQPDVMRLQPSIDVLISRVCNGWIHIEAVSTVCTMIG